MGEVTSLIQIYFQGRKQNAKKLSYYLLELGFKRNKLKGKENHLRDWLLLRCGVPSGRYKRYFKDGTAESMYSEYFCYCVELGMNDSGHMAINSFIRGTICLL